MPRYVAFLRGVSPMNANMPELKRACEHQARAAIEVDRASILAVRLRDTLAAYVPREADPAFMRVIERTFGKDTTTRTLDTVKKCATP